MNAFLSDDLAAAWSDMIFDIERDGVPMTDRCRQHPYVGDPLATLRGSITRSDSLEDVYALCSELY
jgi:hypothetical protein